MHVEPTGNEALDFLGKILSPAVALCVAIGGAIAAWIRRISGKVDDQRVRIAVLETQQQECAEDRRDSLERQRQIHADLHKLASKIDTLIGEFRAARRADREP